MLDQERDYYAAHVEEWEKSSRGKFVAIKGDELIGIFDTQGEALEASAARYGLSPYLVRKIGQKAETVSVPALTLGLLRADS